MEVGFNFKKLMVEDMNQYEVLDYFFDFEEDYNNQPLNKGADNLEHFFSTIAIKLEKNKNYLINVRISNKEFLDYEDYFSLFSAFGFVLTNDKSLANRKDYLAVPQNLKDSLICTDYTLLKMINNEFDYGTIQMCITDSFETEVRWANRKRKAEF